MRRPRVLARAAAAAAFLLLSGCGAGDPVYYRVAPSAGPALPAAGGMAVAVLKPTVAGYLDRDFIVASVSDYRLHLAGNDAWAEPIADMIGRTLTTDLAQRLPGSRVLGPDDDRGGRVPDARISLDVARFDRDAGGAVLLRGTLTVRGADGTAPRSQTLDLTAPDPGPGTAPFVAAESRLLGEVADRAAAALGSGLPRSFPAPVPLASADPTD